MVPRGYPCHSPSAHHGDERPTTPQPSFIAHSDNSCRLDSPVTTTRPGSRCTADLVPTARPLEDVLLHAPCTSVPLPSFRRALSDTAAISTLRASRETARTEGLSRSDQEEPYVPGLGRIDNSETVATGQDPSIFIGAFADENIDPELPNYPFNGNFGLLTAVGGGVSPQSSLDSLAFIDKCSQEINELLTEIPDPKESNACTNASGSATKVMIRPELSAVKTEELGNQEESQAVAIPKSSRVTDPCSMSDNAQHDRARSRTCHRPPTSPSISVSASGTTNSQPRTTPHYCPEHNKYFQKRTDLERHSRSSRLHPGTARQYTCPACRRSISANVDNLSRHLHNQHGWSAERRHALISGLRPKGRRTSVSVADTA